MELMKKNKNLRKLFKFYVVGVNLIVGVIGASQNVFATNDPLTIVNNLSDFIFGITRAVGMILTGFGIVQFGLSFKSHDASQRANGVLTILGGIIITCAKEILNLITAS